MREEFSSSNHFRKVKMAPFRLTQLIRKKQKKENLSPEEMHYFIESVVNRVRPSAYPAVEIADPCQVGAMLMAMYLNGMDAEETATMTSAMTSSGHVFCWRPEWRHRMVDKHSTGGVGDKVSLVLAPALAALGLKVPMISGRALQLTGGTLDKLESIPGFTVDCTKDKIEQMMEDVGCCIVGQTEELVPADREIYRCRDLTATVDSVPLMICSIVSKKLAEGVCAVVYDVKFGKGAIDLISTEDVAVDLAKKMVAASQARGMKSSAVISNMDSPLGNSVGNSLEVMEAVQCLLGNGPLDLQELVEELGGELLRLVNIVDNRVDGASRVREALHNGNALNKFRNMLIEQGVSEDVASCLCEGKAENILPAARHITDFTYTGETGKVVGLDAAALARVWKEEMDRSAEKNYGAGIIIEKHLGDQIESGEIWLKVHHDSSELSESQLANIKKILTVDSIAFASRHRVARIITSTDKRVRLEDETSL